MGEEQGESKQKIEKNLWEEIRLLKEAVRKHEEILAELRAGGRRFGG